DDLALAAPGLLAKVVLNKSLMFADNKASYGTSVLGSLRLVPTGELSAQLRADYEAMTEMFMVVPPTFEGMMASIAALEAKLNQ
ncbi:MAG: nucleotidyl transferase AbiEii/AbiGii toxin family protein, partial [Sphingobium sp.]|nr:nucleotidyl transferase AbiEii/AbiGii toxin family protein [Sphingobium sp.]